MINLRQADKYTLLNRIQNRLVNEVALGIVLLLALNLGVFALSKFLFTFEINILESFFNIFSSSSILIDTFYFIAGVSALIVIFIKRK